MSFFQAKHLPCFFKYAYKTSTRGIIIFTLGMVFYLIYCVNFPNDNDFKKGFLKQQLIGNQVYSRLKSSLFISCWAKVSLLSDAQVTELTLLNDWNQTPPFSPDDMTLDSRSYWFAQDCWDELPSEYYALFSEGTFDKGNFYEGVGNNYMVLFLPQHKLLLSMASHE